MSEPKHSPEPWRYVEMQESGKSHPTPMLAEGPYAILLANTPLGESYARAAANTQRAGQCVNALAGVANPAEQVARWQADSAWRAKVEPLVKALLEWRITRAAMEMHPKDVGWKEMEQLKADALRDTHAAALDAEDGEPVCGLGHPLKALICGPECDAPHGTGKEKPHA